MVVVVHKECCCFAVVRRLFSNSARQLPEERRLDGFKASPSDVCLAKQHSGQLLRGQQHLKPTNLEIRSEASVSPLDTTSEDAMSLAREGIFMENGFQVVVEPPRIEVDPKNISEFSLPQEAISYQPQDAQIFARFKHGDFERMIHCHTPLLPEEQRGLKELQELAARENAIFYPGLAAAATRFLNDARGDVKKALASMQRAKDWRINYFQNGPITDADIAEDMAYGVVYFAGRDSCMRPILVARPARTPPHLGNSTGVKKLIKGLIFMIEYFQRYMTVPGKVENMVILLDLKGLSISQIPLSSLHEVAHVLTQQHASRVWKFYICNMSMLLRGLSTLVQAVMTDRQKKKIMFVKKASDLQQDIAVHQLEEDLGGTHPVFQTFFPFHMHPGPFEVNSVATPEEEAVRGCHELLSAAGARGRLWDPALSIEDNTRLEYSASARQILQKCNLPIPKQLMDHGDFSREGADDVQSTFVASSLSSFVEEAAVSDAEQEVLVQEAEVGPVCGQSFSCGWFGCKNTSLS